MLSTEELAKFCKEKALVYPSSEIYGGMKGFFDYGPLGVELLNNIKQSWWNYFVKSRDNVIGMDSSIIANPRIWKASGHLENFGDMVTTCSKCKAKFRADHLIEDNLNKNVEGESIDEINRIIDDNNITCPECEGKLEELKDFNLLFKTNVGPEESKASTAYMRGETAQAMFTNFKLLKETTRQKLPFGVAQIGKCFRNEIAPRDFMFRSREFNIAELEFFIHPQEKECNELTQEHRECSFLLSTAEDQENGRDGSESTIGYLIDNKKLGEWHGYWLAEQIMWLRRIGLKDMKVREHSQKELSHYSSATYDIDFQYPFGTKEIAGNANRGQYDLTQHINESGEKLEMFDDDSQQKVVPRVIEPTFGVERVFLALITQGYVDDKERGNKVLKLEPSIAPIKVAVYPLVKKLKEKTGEIYSQVKKEFDSIYDQGGSIGRRYARADEKGIPFCVTVDFDTLEDDSVTIRHRDSTKQERVKINELNDKLRELIY
ncbi:MAG: glycine--tRNA ligase [Nanobdellota archaeon]